MKLNELTESIDSQIAELATKYTDGDFICTHIKLTSLEGCPTDVGSDFDCSYNYLTSLEHSPTIVHGGFFCYNNKLTSLQGCSIEVSETFDCSYNWVTSLEHCPTKVTRVFDCRYNEITSLVGIHKHIKSCEKLWFDTKKMVEGGLGLLLIKNLTGISTDFEPFEIIEKYLGQGVKGLPRCQQELVDAGYEKFAKL